MELSQTAQSFRTALAAIAAKHDITIEKAYDHWKSYAKSCESGDQSPVLCEFEQVIADVLKPAEQAPRAKPPQLTLKEVCELVEDHACETTMPLALISHGAQFPVRGFYVINGEVVLSCNNDDDRAKIEAPHAGEAAHTALRSPQDLTEDKCSDAFVWVWSELERSWSRCNDYAVLSFFRTWPKRYTHWLPDDALPFPCAVIAKLSNGGQQ